MLVGFSACLMVLAAGPDPEARSWVIQGLWQHIEDKIEGVSEG